MAGKPKTPSFQIGDIVVLKSGGPEMTVHGTAGAELHCKWFAGKKLENDFFLPDALMTAVQAREKAQAETENV